MKEIVTLKIGGRKWTGWKSVTITRGLKEASAAFALGLLYTDPDSGKVLELQSDMDCELYTRPEGTDARSDELLITGTTSDDDSDESGTKLTLGVNGKSHTQRLVKNSCLHETGRLTKMTPLQIAQTLAAPYGVIVIATVNTGSAIPVFRLEPGEKVFEAIERACRGRGLLITDDEQGRLVLCRKGTQRNNPIVHGGSVDVVSWGHNRSSADRYTEYRVIGQKAGNDQAFGDAVAGCEGVVYDNGWTKYRHVLTIIAEGEADGAACQARAEWEAAVRSGNASKMKIPVRGWRGPAGTLWKTNQIVRVKYPRRGIDRDMLIADVEYKQDDGGTIANLTLSIPSAFDPEPPTKRLKSGNWIEDRGN